MYKCFKLQLCPTESDIAILESQSRIAHTLYNKLLDSVKLEIDFFKTNNIKNKFNPFNSFDLRNQVPLIKKESPVFCTLYSSIAKNVSFRLSDGINRFLDCRKHPERYPNTVGFPKFRSWKRKGFFSMKYEDPMVGYKIKDNKLLLSFGKDIEGKRIKIEVSFNRTFKLDLKTICTLEIIKRKGKYFACFACKVPDLEKKPIKRIIAFDPNHKNLAVGYSSNQESIEIQNLYYQKIFDKRIDAIKSKRDQYNKGSRRWIYLNQRISRLETVQREQIKVGLRTISNVLCADYDLIAVGDYIPSKGKYKQMNRAMLNQTHIGEFRRILEHTCNRSGKHYMAYDEYRTTKTCSACGFVGNSLDPSVREWTCEACGEFHLRDENAAQNGYRIITKEKQLPCSGHLDILSRWTLRFNGQTLKRKEIKTKDANFGSKST